jgi:hypothetical protein
LGQAIWRSDKNAAEIAGELVVATHPDGRAFLEFTKTPLPLVVVRTSPDSWQIQFDERNRSYSGHGQPPAESGWLQVARCLAGAAPPRQCRWERFEGGRWRLENISTGEMLEGYLTQ